MKDFEFSHEAVAKLDEQVEQRGADKDEDRDDDPVEQTLKVPTERSEDEATEFVQKQYKEKSGLDLDEESARGIVKTAQSGGESSESDSDSDSEKDSDSDSESESDSDKNSDSDKDADSKDDSAKAKSSSDDD
jgi:serine-aspartate repeat-containing protein C/D/E